MAEWGEPRSGKRLKNLQIHWLRLRVRAPAAVPPTWMKRSDWESDLQYLEDAYYKGQYDLSGQLCF